MKMDKIASSKNDEFYTPRYAINPLLKYIAPEKTIWCPFDTADSLIVKVFQEHGNHVVFSHLDMGYDFFTTDMEGDVIVSNPPYSLKGKVFENLFSRKRPFAMLVGVAGLFESQYRFELFKNNSFEIMWMNKRIAYFKNFKEQKPSLNPPFSSVWVTQNVLPSKNIFEYIEK